MKAFVEIVKEQLSRRGVSPIGASLDAGLNRDAIRSVLRGRVPSVERAVEICAALGLDLYIGPPRSQESGVAESPVPYGQPPAAEGLVKAEDLSDKVVSALKAETKALRDDLVERFTALSRPSLPAGASADEALVDPVFSKEVPDLPGTRYVELCEVDAAAGGGSHIEDAPVIGYVAFQRVCMDKLGADPGQCTVIRVKGESMEPTLPGGCWILVDRGRRRRLAGRMYLVHTEDGLIVKRLGKDDESNWLLESDHPAWESEPWPYGAEVIGEVRWSSRMYL